MDGNKRVGHAALNVMLMLNGCELEVSIDEAEAEILAAAAGERTRKQFEEWVVAHLKEL